MEDAGRRARAEARRRRAILHKSSLQVCEADLSPVRGAEAVSLVARLAVESWAMAGRALPDYSRDRIPVRFVPWPGT